jgi:methylated-DNA-[protein]-cysteine S-methyltransferase
MPTIHTQTYDSPCGELLLGAFEGQLCLCDWRYRRLRSEVDARLKRHLQAEFEAQDDEVLVATRAQLEAYFRGERRSFDLPLRLAGTDFQQKVWHALLQVEYGTTATYLELSQRLGDVKAIRAVASANGANAISIIVPCHRIVGSDGDLVGYAGGLPAKKHLLTLENPRWGRGSAAQLQLDF